MAYLGDDDKQNTNQQGSPTNGYNPANGQPQAGAGTTPLVGTGTGSVTGAAAPSQAAPGAGGSGGWTNIQSYLTANQGNTGSSDTLANNVGKAFQSDKDSISSSAQDTQDKAQQAGQSNYMAPDQASQLLQQATSMYTPSNQSQDYQGIVQKFQNDINGTYGGPQQNSFQPSLSANTQNYGQALGNDAQLNAMMSNFYNQSSQNGLNQGQMDLQNVLAANDPNFQNTRQDLLQQYAGLAPWMTNQVNNTNQAIQGAQDQYKQNKQDLSNYLTGQQNTDQSQINSQVAAENALIQNLGQEANAYFGKNYGSDNPYYSNNYNVSGPQVTAANATGVTPQINSFDTIQNILNNPSQLINQQTPIDLRNETYTQNILGRNSGSPVNTWSTTLGDFLNQMHSGAPGTVNNTLYPVDNYHPVQGAPVDTNNLYSQALGLGMIQPESPAVNPFIRGPGLQVRPG